VTVDLRSLLRNRRWTRCLDPFPHVLAHDVFRPAVHDRLAAAFSRVATGAPYMPRHDIFGRTLTAGMRNPFMIFTSRAWHDLLAGVIGVDATGHVNAGLHHHAPGSAHGFPHNDLNPGWFVAGPGRDGIVLPRPRTVAYTTGATFRPGVATVETVRAVAMIYFVANPDWTPAHGGETGLYAGPGDDPEAPVVAVPPVENSLLAFECTPGSYHGFIANRAVPRNSVIMWLHRPRAEAVRRWGAGSIVEYG